VLVGVDGDLPLAGLDHDRRELCVKTPRLDGRAGLALALHGEGVLLVAGDPELLRQLLRGLPHHHVREGAVEAVLVHGVHEGRRAEPVAPPHLRQVEGQAAHGLRAARHRHVHLTAADGVCSENDRLQAGTTGHVDRGRAGRLGDAGADGDLSSHVRTAAGLSTVAHEDLAHRRGGDSAGLQRGAYRLDPEICGRQVGEGAQVLPDGRAPRGDDCDPLGAASEGVFHGRSGEEAELAGSAECREGQRRASQSVLWANRIRAGVRGGNLSSAASTPHLRHPTQVLPESLSAGNSKLDAPTAPRRANPRLRPWNSPPPQTRLCPSSGTAPLCHAGRSRRRC